MLIWEILPYEQWKYKHGTVELGKNWKRLGESSSSLEWPKFKVDDRAVRDRIYLQIKKFKKNKNNQRVSIGISLEEELDIGIRNIIEQFDEGDKVHPVGSTGKKQKLKCRGY